MHRRFREEEEGQWKQPDYQGSYDVFPKVVPPNLKKLFFKALIAITALLKPLMQTALTLHNTLVKPYTMISHGEVMLAYLFTFALIAQFHAYKRQAISVPGEARLK